MIAAFKALLVKILTLEFISIVGIHLDLILLEMLNIILVYY
jgi:hypothetical protein